MGRPRKDNIRSKRISEQDYSESDYPGVGGKYVLFAGIGINILHDIFFFLYIYLLKYFPFSIFIY